MSIRPALVFVLLGVFLIHEAQSSLIAAKVLAAKKPLLLAKVVVAKEVGLKTKIAAKKTAAAAKATALAVKSAVFAPFKVAKKTIAIKIAALKAAKALKAIKIAKLLSAKSSPQLLLPQGPVAVIPIKNAPEISIPPKNILASGLGSVAEGGVLQKIISGAQNTIASVGNKIPFLETFRNGQESIRVRNEAHEFAYNQPTYRFVPDAGFTHYNNIQFSPNVYVDAPVQTHDAVVQQPHQTYGLPLRN